MKKLLLIASLLSCTSVYANDAVKKRADFLACTGYALGFVNLFEAYGGIIENNEVFREYSSKQALIFDQPDKQEEMKQQVERLFQLADQNALLNIPEKELNDYLFNAYNLFMAKVAPADAQLKKECNEAVESKKSTKKVIDKFKDELDKYTKPSDKVFAQLEKKYIMPYVGDDKIKADGAFSDSLSKRLDEFAAQ